MSYSDKVIDHYNHPRNVGSMDKSSADVGTGLVGAPECGDVMKLQIKVNPDTNVIEDAKFKTFGCGSAIASSSLATEWVKGKTIDEALAIKNTRSLRNSPCLRSRFTAPCWQKTPSVRRSATGRKSRTRPSRWQCSWRSKGILVETGACLVSARISHGPNRYGTTRKARARGSRQRHPDHRQGDLEGALGYGQRRHFA